MKAKKFHLKSLSYVVVVDGRLHAAFDSLCPARDYAQTVQFDRPWTDKLMDVSVVDTSRFNQVVYSAVNGKTVIGG